MPTSSIPGGSLAPMENSPPGIHTIPLGATFGAGERFTTVAANATPLSEGTLRVVLSARCERIAQAASPTTTATAAKTIFPLDCFGRLLVEGMLFGGILRR